MHENHNLTMTTAQQEKAKLRSVYLRKRKMLNTDEYTRRIELLTRHFKNNFSLTTGSLIHVFLPIVKQNEIDTWPIIRHIRNSNARVVVSKSDLNTNRLSHFVLETNTKLQNNKWGIPEPSEGEPVQESKIDMVLVPLLVADKLGQRLGYGKGYYDRFLSLCQPQCLKIGLSLAPPLDYIPCMEPTDIKLNYCISPIGVYKF